MVDQSGGTSGKGGLELTVEAGPGAVAMVVDALQLRGVTLVFFRTISCQCKFALARRAPERRAGTERTQQHVAAENMYRCKGLTGAASSTARSKSSQELRLALIERNDELASKERLIETSHDLTNIQEITTLSRRK